MTRLKNVLSFVALAPGVPTALPHLLNWNDRAVAPDKLIVFGTGVTAAADTTNVTLTNTGLVAVTVLVYCESWHTIERAFGNQSVVALAPQPLILFVDGSGQAQVAGQDVKFTDTPGTLNVFVNSATGSDANDGLTVGTPLATVQAVYDKFPWYYLNGARLVVNLAAGAAGTVGLYPVRSIFLGGTEPIHSSYRYVGPEMVNATLATGPNTTALDVVPAVRVNNAGAPSATGGRTRLDFTVAAPGWTVDDLQGFFIRVTRAGAKVFFELPITQNAAATITVDTEALVGVILATDTVEIVTPGAAFTPNGGDSQNFVGIIGYGVTSPNVFNTVLPFTFTRLGFQSAQVNGYHSVAVPWSMDRCNWTARLSCAGGQYNFVNCSGRGGGLTLTNASVPNGGAGGSVDTVPPINTAAQVALALTKTFNTLVARNSFCSWSKNVTIRGTTVGLIVDGGQFSTLSARLLGSTTTFGIEARSNGVVRVNAATETTELTGTTAPLRLGAGAGINVAYGTGAGQFQQVAGWNGNLTGVMQGAAGAPTSDGSRITTNST